VGFISQLANVSAAANTSVGAYTLRGNALSGYNTAIGYEALINFNPPSGGFGHDTNIAIGSAAMGNATDGGFNIGVGCSSLSSVAGGGENIGIGGGAGINITTGNLNILIGEAAGIGISTTSGSIIIGNLVSGTNTANQLNIGGELTGVMGGAGMQFTYGVGSGVVAVASLPATPAFDGMRYFVNNSSVAASGNFGAIVAGGGTNHVPVYWDDGASVWRIG
jgi:hypothetical protein